MAGNCLSTCRNRSCEINDDVGTGGSASGWVCSPEQAQNSTQAPLLQVEHAKIQVVSSNGKQVCSLVQKELELLQTHISHSQAVLAALRISYFEDSMKKRRNNEYKINRTTQTALPAEIQPKSLEDVSQTKERDWLQLTSSCPAIVNTANIAVQTEFLEAVKVPPINDAEFFLPPIGSPLDFRNEMRAYQDRLSRTSLADHIDLDIYRSCRKLSVLPEEECESPPWLQQQQQQEQQQQQLSVMCHQQQRPTHQQQQQQAHSFDSYLVPASREHHQEQVPRQMSDPTPSRSTRRPLRLQQTSEEDSGVVVTTVGSRRPSSLLDRAQTTYHQDPDEEDTQWPSSPSDCMPQSPDEVEDSCWVETPSFKTPPPPPYNHQPAGRTSSSETSLSFRTPSSGEGSPTTEGSLVEEPPPSTVLALLADCPTAGPQVRLPPPQAQVNLVRAPSSRRRLVRSLVRISSQTPIDLFIDETSENLPVPASDQEVPVSGVLKRMDCVVGDVDGPAPISPPPFPSLSDRALKQLGLWIQSNSEQISDCQFNEEDVESKFMSLMLAFRADKLTLKRRLELQNRLRDQTEINMNNEVEALKIVIQLLEPICMDSEKQEIYERITHQVEALHKSVLRVSSVAEVFGAVQQENRMSKAVDVILAHVEVLKMAYEKEKLHHEQVKKLLSEHKPQASGVASLQKDKRRASIATLHRHHSHSEGINNSHPDLKALGMRKGPHGRRLIHTKSDYISDQHTGQRSLSPTDVSGDLTIHEQDIVGRSSEGGTSSRAGSSSSLGWLRGDDDEDEVDMDSVYPLRRRSSQHPNGSEIESESDEDCLTMSPAKGEEESVRPPAPRPPPRYKFRKRSSFGCCVWLEDQRWDWLRPLLDDYALQARYFLAVVFVLAALAVVSVGFIQQSRLATTTAAAKS